MSTPTFTELQTTALQTPHYVRNDPRACGLCSYKKRKCYSLTLITTASGRPGQLCKLCQTNGFESCPPPPDKNDVDKNCREILKMVAHLKDRRKSRSTQRAKDEDARVAKQVQIPAHGTGAGIHEAEEIIHLGHFIPNPTPHLPILDDTQESIYASSNQAIQPFVGYPSPTVFQGPLQSTTLFAAAQHVLQQEQNHFHAPYALNDATNSGAIMSDGATPVEYSPSIEETNELAIHSPVQAFGGFSLSTDVPSVYRGISTTSYTAAQYVPQPEQNDPHAPYALNDATDYRTIMPDGATPVEYSHGQGGTSDLAFFGGLGSTYEGNAGTVQAGSFAIGVAPNSTHSQLSLLGPSVYTNTIRSPMQAFGSFPPSTDIRSVFHDIPTAPSTAAHYVPQPEQDHFHALYVLNNARDSGSIASDGATPMEYSHIQGRTNEHPLFSALEGQRLTAGTIHNASGVGKTSAYGLPQYEGDTNAAQAGSFATGVALNSTHSQLSFPRPSAYTNAIHTPNFPRPTYDNIHRPAHYAPAHALVASPASQENHPPVQGGSYMTASSSMDGQPLCGNDTNHFHQNRGNPAALFMSNQSFEAVAEGLFGNWNNGSS